MLYNPSHYLFGCRLDNWIRLLALCRFRILPEKRLQALAITLTSLLLSPVALLEAAITAIPAARKKKTMEDPIFIIGHWRSGTSFLQNILTRDEQFSWSDPVSTDTFPYSILLRPFLNKIHKAVLDDARPMDNLKYRIDLPIEDTYAVAEISPISIIHMCALPIRYEYFVKGAFISDLSEKEHREWRRKYDYVLRKFTVTQGGRRLLLKSPDNTCRLPDLMEMYPNAQYINIHREPYVTVKSTVHMFLKQMERLQLTPTPPTDLEELVEDTIIGIFKRMYTDLFRLQKEFRPGQYVEIRYEDFEKDPESHIRRIYETLGLGGYEEALPKFREYIDSQKGYVKNKFDISPRLREKVDRELGFYFDHYGYPRWDGQDREAV